MNDHNDLHAIERRARAADHRDGLMELYAAALMLVLALTWLAGPEFVGIFAALAIIFFPRLLTRAKERVTYPRIGYSADLPDDAKSTARGMLIFLAAAVALMVAAVLIFGDVRQASEWRRAAPLLAGLAFSGGFWYAAGKSGLLRHRFMAAASITLGVITWVLGTGDDYRPVGLYLLAMGGLLLIIGISALAGFLRSNPVLDDDAHS